MAEQELTKESLYQKEVDPELYYDYEARFIKQKLEADHLALLPRVIKPAMFAKTGFALGDARVWERYGNAPLSCLTAEFVELGPGQHSDKQRMIPSQVAYVLEGSGECVQDGKSYAVAAEDVALIPAYTTRHFVAGPSGVKAFLPQVRYWHLMGLLWQEEYEAQRVPDGTEPLKDKDGPLVGFRVPAGILGLERDLDVRFGANKKREDLFAARRAVTEAPGGSTKYDWFLKNLADENRREAEAPRVIKAADVKWESTRQGRQKWYINHWTDVVAPAFDLVVTEVEPGGHSGQHRHIFEEMLLVLDGKGYDMQENTRQQWAAGDIICVPPMIAHQHFAEGDKPARLLSVWSRELGHEFLGGIEHLADASSWGR
jgi:quercetin dioxygenase-like cupin family protein